MIQSMDEAIRFIFATRRRLDSAPRGPDEYTRDITPTRNLLERENLLAVERDYVVVTGSRGKGSVTAIMAKLLEALGHRVGTVTSPHLVHWNERIRVDGRMIPTPDFLRILNGLRPIIDDITADLNESRYLSPQGIFLAIALRYFAETGVDVAVLEVGRGGRFDDVAVVPNTLSVFTPIMLEHTSLLGDTLDRIAWHKAGIIKSGGRVITLTQAPAVIDVIRRECAEQEAQLDCLFEEDLARWVACREDGQLIRLHPYGELDLPMLGSYQIENATLAIRAVELLERRETRLDANWIDTVRLGLTQVQWRGRVQKLDDCPAIYVDGAITVSSAESFVASLQRRFRGPVVSIVGIPRDRDYAGVYRVMANVSRALIITETDINPNTRFPTREQALTAAQDLHNSAHYRKDLPAALKLARSLAGESGAILMALSLMLVGECMLIWDVDTTAI
ncbi:MAG: Mur ligase family protein [Chloroflexi bacterium]|nr:Mur ligase family protein [Chloroflexota bacterium]